MTHTDPARVLLISTDDVLLDELLRLCAAAGVVPDVARDVSAALRMWSGANLVVVGADIAGPMAMSRPARRPAVHVVGLGEVRDALFREALDLGAQDVSALPSSESWLVELLTDATDGVAGGHARGLLVAVLGGSGGVGATVFTAGLGAVLADSAATLLVDLDPMGPGLDRIAGLDHLPGVRWSGLSSATGRLSARHLRDSLPRHRNLSVLTWGSDGVHPLQPFAVREVLSAAQRGHDVVLVDVPRYPDPVADDLLSRADHVVLLSAGTVAAVTSAARVAARLEGLGGTKHLVVRGSRGVDPDALADLLDVDLVAVLGDQRGLDEAIELGAGPVRSRRCALARAARAVTARMSGPSLLVA